MSQNEELERAGLTPYQVGVIAAWRDRIVQEERDRCAEVAAELQTLHFPCATQIEQRIRSGYEPAIKSCRGGE